MYVGIGMKFRVAAMAGLSAGLVLATSTAWANPNVYITRFWHNHQPIYWPEWNGNGSQTERVQYAYDTVQLKNAGVQSYGTGEQHPNNGLAGEPYTAQQDEIIFTKDDRVQAYQGRPRDSLNQINQAGGFAMSYSGSLMANVRSFGQNNSAGYGSGWWDGMREASGWTTPSGSPRLDVVGFTYHHSIAPLLPKAVLRKELQTFKSVWWKVLNKSSSSQSKGFFPTEMAFSKSIIDVLVEEGFEWSIVASHHLSRTCPTYVTQSQGNPASYQIKSSPPNKADRIGPSPTSGWWYNEPNPGQGALNVSPFAYQLHKAKYVNPENGAVSEIIVVPSDDVLSYQAGYSGAQMSVVDGNIAPGANDANRPLIVMPSTDGDNAWGGGSSSWMESTPAFFGAAQSSHKITSPQDFVNAFGQYATEAHVEDGAWIFPTDDYGSPYFLKWIEPPLIEDSASAGDPRRYPGTKANMEGPGFALKFWSWAPVIAGANWCETAEQVLIGEGGTVDSWKIQDPYDWNGGAYVNPNVVERAWHIYLAGLDSGFNYYGGLGNDDEVKQSLATRRAYDLLNPWMTPARKQAETVGPTILKPQRFPYNPGWYTFGWFNSFGTGTNAAYLKKMPSEFYIWSHIYDLNGVQTANLKVRIDGDGVNSLASDQNETYAGGAEVGAWVTIPMTMKALPKTTAALNAAANNSQINYFIEAGAVADYYFAKITDTALPGFRGKLLDYYIEATDTRGNIRKTDIQHVWVEDDGQGGSTASFSSDPRDCAPLEVTYQAAGGNLDGISPVYQQISFNGGTNWTRFAMSGTNNVWAYTNVVPDNAPSAIVWFENSDGSLVDSQSGQNWSTPIRDCDAPTGTVWTVPSPPEAGQSVTITYNPAGRPLAGAATVNIHHGYNGGNWTTVPGVPMTPSGAYWTHTYTIPAAATNIMMAFNNNSGTWDNNGGQDWKFTVNAGSPLPGGFAITNPAGDIVVGNAVTSYDLRGLGEGVVGSLLWTNSLTGGSGTAPAAHPWLISGIPLGVGANLITVIGTNVGSAVTTNAADGSANYASWTNGSTGGVGFGAWFFNHTQGTGFAGVFIGNPTNAGLAGMGTQAFGFYANPAGSGATADISRAFSAPMETGSIFRFKLGLNWDSNVSTSRRGFDLLAGGTPLVSISMSNNAVLAINGASLFNNYGVQAMTIQMEFISNGSIRVWGTGRNGSEAYDQTLAVPAGVPTGFRMYFQATDSSDNRQMYFNDLALLAPSSSVTSDAVTITREGGGLDADGDGIPDAWEIQHFGCATCAVASADGDADGASAWEEYIAGTIPTNAASVWTNRIMQFGGLGEMSLWVPAPTTNSRVYEAWYTTNLTDGPWVPMGFDQPGPANGASFYFTVTNAAEMRVYRTGVKLP